MKFTKNIEKELLAEIQGYFTSGSHDFEHTQRVYNTCEHIGKTEKADMGVVRAATILHDIARVEEDDSKGQIRHEVVGSERSKEILNKYDLPDDFICHVTDCIRTHRYRGDDEPQTIEAKILFDADKLDVLGAVGAARLFYWSGEVSVNFHVDYTGAAKEYSDADCSYNEWMVKCQYIKDRLYTKEGRKIGQERHQFMDEFFKRFLLEIKGEK